MNGTEKAIEAMTRELVTTITARTEDAIYNDGYRDAMWNVRALIAKIERDWDTHDASGFASDLRKAIEEDMRELEK